MKKLKILDRPYKPHNILRGSISRKRKQKKSSRKQKVQFNVILHKNLKDQQLKMRSFISGVITQLPAQILPSKQKIKIPPIYAVQMQYHNDDENYPKCDCIGV